MAKRILAWAIFSAVILSSQSLAYFGTRPMGMGGAFTAVADDANAAYWNPAGFALNPGVDIIGSTLATNRNAAMGDNLASVKMCYEANMNSPFDWIFGVGALSALAVDTAHYLGDRGVLKKNWGRDVQRTGRDESMAEQVAQAGDETGYSRDPFKRAVPKLDAQNRTSIFGPLHNINLNFYPGRYTYWDRRYRMYDDLLYNKAQFALGLTWLGDNNPLLDEHRNWYTVSLASGWEERIAFGGNINFYDLRIISSGVRGFGAGVDIGAIAKPLPNASFGLVAKEILTTDINWQNGAQTRYEMMINGGVAIDPIDEVTLAVDGHNIFGQNNSAPTMHYGVEVRPVRGLAFRAGLYDQSKTAGASIGLGSLIIDYAYLGGQFNRTQTVAATWKF